MKWFATFLAFMLIQGFAAGENLPQCPAPKNQAPADTAHQAIRIIASGENYNDMSGTKNGSDPGTCPVELELWLERAKAK